MEENKQPGSAPDEPQTEVQKAMKRQRTVIIILCAVVVLGAVGVIGYLQGWFGPKDAKQQTQADLDENTTSFDGKVGNAPKADPAADSIAIPGYPKIYAIAGDTKMEITLGNPEGNPCFFVYELSLKDSGEVLYTSKQIPPGEAVDAIELSRALDAGEYPAVLGISTFHVETLAAMNGADVETILIVQ